MGLVFETERLEVHEAEVGDIPKIMELEEHPDNKNFIWQGSYDEHLEEIKSDSALLFMFKAKCDSRVIGYGLMRLNEKSEVFELRRIAISEKGMGFGKEVMLGIMKYCFEDLHMNRFWLDVYPDNIIGIKLYTRLGLVYEGTLRQSYKSERGYLNQMIYSLLKDEYYKKYR
ncbi:GNAT family N-acetyltransferase [Anaeromicrobium sediminis]|uniref:N-acetyltransferase domain-containing protein n=1 Tax=Anaeromicrobium sediminis TaxID=1478221 RepID=A0A267MHN2_9FIRM|nr:GNAT family protein [Anaeromicrobium sediminis]PAB59036.1 hypothetical protein CCE28_12700 [Anaeromicrobium sediminis]